MIGLCLIRPWGTDWLNYRHGGLLGMRLLPSGQAAQAGQSADYKFAEELIRIAIGQSTQPSITAQSDKFLKLLIAFRQFRKGDNHHRLN